LTAALTSPDDSEGDDSEASNAVTPAEGTPDGAPGMPVAGDSPNNIRYPDNWIDTLNQTESRLQREPAIVIEVQEKSIRVVDRNQSIHQIEWTGLEWARRYIDPNTMDRSPSKAADIVSVGDLVRIALNENGHWVLSQTPQIQGGMVALDPDTGAIKALVGGYHFFGSQFNHVTQARRQPGSNFKPFFYAAAIESGLTPATILNDAPIVLEGGELEEEFRPKNAGRFHGKVRLREALYFSLNLVSIRVILELGASKAVNYVRRFGFDTENFPRDIQMALGGGTIALTPLEVATGYAAFANGGYKVDPYVIQAIESLDGGILFTANPAIVCPNCDENGEVAKSQTNPESDMPLVLVKASPRPPRIIEERAAYIMDSILADVVRRGTATKAMRELGRGDLRGKTGTTNDADIWFSGYTRELVATVWAGFDDNSPLGDNEWGSTVPLDTWIDFARTALPPESETRSLKEPDGLVRVRIDPKTGFRARPGDPDGIFEIFREENAPAPLPASEQHATEVENPLERLF
ncbi:MAG: penicillin-binding transpeptidase domain-containing protein, partial [Gammaproteobacteria bacterium]|nr:penicillin-binding transpeptidase domain-containing protein [Gammaproteobacteria bacterium]